MIPEGFDEFDHESHMRRAIDLAREAVDRGDHPFGSVLVRDDAVVMTESNRVNTLDDIRRHPELHLAFRAAQNMNPSDRAKTVMYTSTEPCPMCAGGIRSAGLARIVYSVGSDELPELVGSQPHVRSSEILGDAIPVDGPVLHEEGRAVHEDYDW